jgi:AcrR family transcriptional regulator
MRLQLVEAAARLLTEHGRGGLSVRNLAAAVGASTQAVYTYFDGVDGVVAEVCREGFRRFGAALDEPAVTDDPVADYMAQGWGYRRFALRNPDLYLVMFGDGLHNLQRRDPADAEAAGATFLSLLTRLERCRESGRWQFDDLVTSGEVVWESSHGHAMLEVHGYFTNVGRDPVATYTEGHRRLSLGFGDDPELVARSLQNARRRARRADAA